MTEFTTTVHEKQFKEALKHGCELWWDKSTPTKRLDQRNGRDGFTRFVNARTEGKLGEEAFRTLLREEFGIKSQVDYRIYGDYDQTDNGDLQYLVGDDGNRYKPSVEFDVKMTKPWNSWLAIRRSMYEQHPDDAPFILTKLAIEDDLVVDEWADSDDWTDVINDVKFVERYNDFVARFPVQVEIVGTAYPDEFTDMFDEGDRLYDPDSGRELGGPLRMDNAGIHVDDLVATDERWNRVVDDITGDNPIGYEEL